MTFELVATEWVDPLTLVPHPENAKLHDLPTIKASLTVNGQYAPIVVWERPRKKPTILAHHGVWEAALELGWEKVQINRGTCDVDTARRIVAVDNRSADLGTYDLAKLLDLVNAIDDLEGTGYTQADLIDLDTLVNPPSLDEVAEKLGAHVPQDLWPEIKVRVPPEVYEAWERYAGQFDSEAEAMEDMIAAQL